MEDFNMFLRLRWDEIDVEPFRTKVISARLPDKDREYLDWLRKKYGIPYAEAFREALVHLRKGILKKWIKYKEIHPRRGYADYLGNQTREQLDSYVAEALRDDDFARSAQIFFPPPKIFNKKMKRMCLQMAKGDLLLLRRLSGRRATMAGYLLYLVREMREHKKHRQREEQHLPYYPFREIRGYKEFKPHKISFRIRVDDLKSLSEFTKQYRRKYSEKLTKSEVICFAHDIFKKMEKVEQERIMEEEKNDRGHGGKTQKIAVSWSDLDRYSTKEKPKRGMLRIALYNLLRSDKLKNLIGEGS